MANALFSAYKAVVLGDAAVGGFSVPDLAGGDQRIILIDSADDTFDPTATTDQDLADVAAGARVATVALSGESVAMSGGTATYDASDATFSAVTGDQSEVVLLYEHTGVEATSLLIVYFDTFSSGMPVTPNGGDIVVQWHASGIFTW